MRATTSPASVTTSLSHFMNAPRPTEVSLGSHDRRRLERRPMRSPATTGRTKSMATSVPKKPLVLGPSGMSWLLIGLFTGWASRSSVSNSTSPGRRMAGMVQATTPVAGIVTSSKPAARVARSSVCRAQSNSSGSR